mgnify:FL=1
MGATPSCPMGSRTGSVSIHAPVMGATVQGYVYDALHRVSIHAPVMGATLDSETLRIYAEFQSTRP